MKSAEDHEREFEERPLWKSWKWIIGAIVVVLLIGGGLFALRVATSGVVGRGQAHIDKNDAKNFEAAQSGFHREYNDYLAIVGRNGTLAVAVKNKATWEKQHPEPVTDPIADNNWSEQDGGYQTTVDGLTQNCHNIVSSYNTDSESYLTQDFKDHGLPATLSDAGCNPTS